MALVPRGRPAQRNTPRNSAAAALTAALLAAFAAVPATAEEAAPALREVVVSATRTETPTSEVPATVTTLERDAIERRLPRDDADLFRDEPDISMARDVRRFGATRVNIRGIEDNRVIQLVDGVRLPDFYNGGGPTNFTMNAVPGVMPDFLRRLEIVRGPASSLYGSDAIGGVVGYVTLDPADLLGHTGEEGQRAARVRATYTGANHGIGGSVIGAFRTDAVEVLLGYGHARGEETDNKGNVGGISSARSRPNPQDTEDDGLLAKLVLRPGAGNKLSAIVEAREQQVDTDVRRIPPSMRKVTAMQGDDEAKRVRASLEWETRPAGGWVDRLTLRAYAQDADTTNDNTQRRSNTSATCSAAAGSGNDCLIDQRFTFEQESYGANLLAEKALTAGTLEHVLSGGVDIGRVRVEEKRNARILNQTSGATLTTLAGESYPLRDFAIGVTDTVGVFVQDEIAAAGGGKLTVIPGLRYDWTHLKPEPDALARQALDALGRRAVSQTHQSLSPKLALRWQFDQALSAYGQLARGFRAPNYVEVNGAFRNSTQFYSVVPNPDLDPETSVGVELGLRYAANGLRAQFAVYDNRYKDFIESVELACPADPRCYAPTAGWRTNMAVNLSRVRIYGAEARADWQLAPGWRVDGALAWARGSDQKTHEPINSIEPARLSLGLLHDAGSWGAEGRVRAAARKRRIDESVDTFFHTPGYAVADLHAWWQLAKQVRVTASVTNLFDRKYWLWSDIRQADDTDPLGVAFYSQPGRRLSVALQADF